MGRFQTLWICWIAINRRQTIDTFDFPISKDTLEGVITYEAADSGVLLVQSKQLILYGKASTTYTDLALNASTIKLDQEKNLITAYGSTDTLGNPLDKPKLVQGGTDQQQRYHCLQFENAKGFDKKQLPARR